MSDRQTGESTVRELEASSGVHPIGGVEPLDLDADPRGGEKALRYKVICISMYKDDLKRLDGMVESLKARGLTRANRSALIRYALGGVDLESVPKGL